MSKSNEPKCSDFTLDIIKQGLGAKSAQKSIDVPFDLMKSKFLNTSGESTNTAFESYKLDFNCN